MNRDARALSSSEAFRLTQADGGLELRAPAAHGGPEAKLRVDFSKVDLRPNSPSMSRRQPLARAIGAKNTTVIDATAGLGGDSFLLACLGWTVRGLERHEALATLLTDGLRRAEADPVIAHALGGRLTFEHADAIVTLPALDPRPDVIYIDPMYPPRRKKSALAKKSIRLVRALVGDDPDSAALLDVARRTAVNRVVVKRPPHAPPLANDPMASYGGKLVRYDAFTPRPA